MPSQPQQPVDPRHAAILAHLDKWWKNRTCRICGTLPTWESDLYPYTMNEYVVLSQPTKALAVIHLLCSGCGHLELFGAAKVGAMDGLPSITYTPAEQAQPTEQPGAEMDPLYLEKPKSATDELAERLADTMIDALTKAAARHGTDANGSPVEG